MENLGKMFCAICEQEVNIRKLGGWSKPLPVAHKRPDHVDPCHGFYITGQFVKEK